MPPQHPRPPLTQMPSRGASGTLIFLSLLSQLRTQETGSDSRAASRRAGRGPAIRSHSLAHGVLNSLSLLSQLRTQAPALNHTIERKQAESRAARAGHSQSTRR